MTRGFGSPNHEGCYPNGLAARFRAREHALAGVPTWASAAVTGLLAGRGAGAGPTGGRLAAAPGPAGVAETLLPPDNSRGFAVHELHNSVTETRRQPRRIIDGGPPGRNRRSGPGP
ncbi:hypothetical protein GCM10017567_54450 [Amycolatopsis bullii]|uniref:Uncharacterized protein n=1 Tax=Amycolatopsis bullii TaxID=941987 RepID=A0ABQ3KJ33_9PSEU|nr:hypothetical protein GCM10017567_54450 [Amycolatopsis bullii]